MNASLSDWLALREPADAAARSLPLTRWIAAALASSEPVRVLDLGTGTGANLRYLIEKLPPRQQWLVADVDPELLSRLYERTSAWGAARGYTVERDGQGLAIRGARLDCRVAVRNLDLDALPFELFADRQLVTASALLDLVSERWLRELAAHCRAASAAALFALNYDGRSTCSPAEPEDDLLRDRLNAHQLRDKGLGGPAAGPGAEHAAARAFEEQGFRVRRERTDWRLGREHGELQRQLLDGWVHAALELDAALAPAVAAWQARRYAHLDAGRSSIEVGHHDLAALPPRA